MEWNDFLNERPVGVLATVGADGTPHAVPVEVLVRDGMVYCWCESWSAKARNVGRTGKAAITGYKGHSFVLVRGPARLVGSRDGAYAEITRAFLDKYERDDPYGNDVLVEITPERVASARI